MNAPLRVGQPLRPVRTVPDPIDLVLMKLVRDDKNVTARDAAQVCGEHWSRCYDILRSFLRAGLVRTIAEDSMPTVDKIVFAGHHDELVARIALREREVAGAARKILG